MLLSPLDVGVVVAYLAALAIIGLLERRQAARSLDAYLLGGRSMPWYLLGLSNASGMFDVSGTMWLVTIGFVYGVKSIWLPWLWPTFNQVFLMVFLSVWLRRSNVRTGAQWIETRFGSGAGARLSHQIVVLFAIVAALGFLAYGFVGLGKFVEVFLPWESVGPRLGLDLPPRYVPHLYGIVFTLAAVFYTVLGGMRSIVLADVLQYLIMTLSGVVVAILAMTALVASGGLAVPAGWDTPWFGWHLDLDWSAIAGEVNRKIVDDQMSLFSLVFMMMLFKGILASLAGPAPNYDMQKILATRNPREAALMSGFVSIVLFPSRYLMIAGFVVIALLSFQTLDLASTGTVDFERLLPAAITAFVPAGWAGLLLAGLAAAFVGTFSGTLNAAQAYVVNDLYLEYVDPRASDRRTVAVSYAAGLLLVAVSIALGFAAGSVNDLLQWIVSALYGSYVASNVLKWLWWRFNGHGYFWGMVAGLVPALLAPLLLPDTLPLFYFPHLLGLSLVGCVLGTYLSPPTELEVLKRFYCEVRPWGFWGPIRRLVVAEDPSFRPNLDFRRDMVNVVVGTAWQIGLVALPFYVVLMRWPAAALAAGLVAITSLVLKRNWYDRLETA